MIQYLSAFVKKNACNWLCLPSWCQVVYWAYVILYILSSWVIKHLHLLGCESVKPKWLGYLHEIQCWFKVVYKLKNKYRPIWVWIICLVLCLEHQEGLPIFLYVKTCWVNVPWFATLLCIIKCSCWRLPRYLCCDTCWFFHLVPFCLNHYFLHLLIICICIFLGWFV